MRREVAVSRLAAASIYVAVVVTLLACQPLTPGGGATALTASTPLVQTAVQPPAASAPSPPPEVTVVVQCSYLRISRHEVIDHSQVIFVGRVASISHTQWNQDSGAYWEGGLPLHFIEVEVLQPIVDTLGIGQKVTLTQLCYSPLDQGAIYRLEAGQRAVFFAAQADIAWRGGRRSALRLTGYPPDSFIIVGDDRYPLSPTAEAARLEPILQEIAKRRETLAQP
jgi:hypothetical protein